MKHTGTVKSVRTPADSALIDAKLQIRKVLGHDAFVITSVSTVPIGYFANGDPIGWESEFTWEVRQ